MGKIVKLDQHTINSIAAGEVIERPASVVKELVDNALDAGAEAIEISIKSGGIREIRVKDNGTGMSPEDAALSLQSHTTSKLRSVSDLDHISSMGFRGEALASIAAVSRMSLVTCQLGVEDGGYRIEIEGGKVVSEGPCGAPEGTTITVRDLFYNTPARYKFLKSDQAEAAQVQERVTHLALARPDVSFQLERDGKTVLHTPGNNDLLSAIYAVFGSEIAGAMSEVSLDVKPIVIDGYMTRPSEYYRSNRTRQVFIVNGRVVRSRILQVAVDEAAATYFMKGRHPALVFHLTIPFAFVDVNVHPQKSEVRFWDDKKVFSAVYHAARRVLEGDKQPIDTPPGDAQQAEEKSKADDITVERTLPVQQSFTPITPTTHVTFKETAEKTPLPFSQDRNKSIQHGEKNYKTAPEQKSESVEGESAGKRDIEWLAEAKILGQYLNTYIVMQIDDRLVLLDQHAAHERILYERLQQTKLEDVKHSRQSLLIPVEVEVTPEEALYIDTNLERLLDMGFEIESFGPNAYLLRSVPDLKQHVDAKRLFKGLLGALSDNQFLEDSAFRDAFAMKACKAAAKANQSLGEAEIRALLKDLIPLQNPYHCPHGRPITISFSKKEVEKRFGRIV